MNNLFSIFLLILILIASSCEVVEGIFQIGFWAGIIVVVLIIAVIAWLIKKFR